MQRDRMRRRGFEDGTGTMGTVALTGMSVAGEIRGGNVFQSREEGQRELLEFSSRFLPDCRKSFWQQQNLPVSSRHKPDA